jgi:3'-phosphoadenosine 5'-phosphosulfate sulfotransferase (PAPS reductase)/FAD synthetase
MNTYLSFGGGVNSVAMYLYLADQGADFEAVFVDHGCDWPETYQYFAGFQWWLKANGYRPITILRPSVQGSSNLYDHCMKHKMVPSFMSRWCTDKFKVRVLQSYYKAPAWELIGIDAGESHRARIQVRKDIESRYPLVEAGIDREDCKKIIRRHGLPVPIKSGCYICPFQRKSQWRELRTKHPCLFQRAVDLEERNIKYRIERGKPPLFLTTKKMSLPNLVEENQLPIFEQDAYPPCQCGL